MAVSCNQLLCCNETKYKKCEDIICGDGQESQQCKIPKKIKRIDCSCLVMHQNCRNRGIDFGFEKDEDENYIWVEDDCQGLFRVCYNKENECLPMNPITTGGHMTSNVYTSSNIVRTTNEPFENTQFSNKASKSESINKGLLVGLPLVVVFVIIAALILLYTRHHRRKVKKKKTEDNARQKANNTDIHKIPVHNNYMHTIPVDDEVVYDEIRDYGQHHVPDSRRESNMSGSYDDPDNRNGNLVGMPTCGNPNYIVSRNNDIPSEDVHNYYVTPSDTNYFVLEKAGHNVGEAPKQDPVHPSDAPVNYFVLEKCEHNNPSTAQLNDTSVLYDRVVDSSDGYFILEKERECVQ